MQPENFKSSIVDFSIDKENWVIGCIFEDSLFFCNMRLRTAGNLLNQVNQICYRKYNKI